MAQRGLKTDLTEGGVVPQLFHYAVPFILTSLLQSLYSLTDIWIAGHFIGSEGISGISNASQLMDIMTKVAIGLSLGGNILIGQYFGGKDEKNCRRSIGTLLSLFFGLGILSAVLFALLGQSMLSAMHAPAFGQAWAYLGISCWGLFFIMCYNALAAVFRALGNSRAPFYFVLASTCLNIVLDFTFVAGLHWGPAGAALATVMGQALSFALALGYLLRQKELFSFTKEALTPQMDKVATIFKIGIPCGVQMTLAGLSWLTITFLLNRYGVEVSAGNAISSKIRDLCTLFLNAVASAAGTMIAQNIGAEKYDRAKQVMYTAMKACFCVAVGLIVLTELAAPQLVRFFAPVPNGADAAALLSLEQTVQAGINNLRIEILGQVFYSIFFCYHAMMTGSGHTLMVLLSSFVNCIVVRVPLAMVMNAHFGLVGIYWACAIATSSSVPIGMAYLKSGRWRHRLTAPVGELPPE